MANGAPVVDAPPCPGQEVRRLVVRLVEEGIVSGNVLWEIRSERAGHNPVALDGVARPPFVEISPFRPAPPDRPVGLEVHYSSGPRRVTSFVQADLEPGAYVTSIKRRSEAEFRQFAASSCK